ncbi:hypothetical protein QTO34_015931 [Cnephaeus nilssonii]|uniref:Uncharacterized protein n=1 Tax=Cnephaeus nilssonii TaxID=3371016 RepID=A0AA40LR63_CNENI|nr:hypothetical protein QTO34_015931 [Eptesicus nilssonii]
MTAPCLGLVPLLTCSTILPRLTPTMLRALPSAADVRHVLRAPPGGTGVLATQPMTVADLCPMHPPGCRSKESGGAVGGRTRGGQGGRLGPRDTKLASPVVARAQRLCHSCAAAQKGPLGQRAHVLPWTIKSGGAGCLFAPAPGLSEDSAALEASERPGAPVIKSKIVGAGCLSAQAPAFQKPPPRQRLLKGLVHQRTGTQLPRDRKRKRGSPPQWPRTIKSGGAGCLSAPAPGLSEASAEPRLLKGLVHQRTGTQLHREKQKRPAAPGVALQLKGLCGVSRVPQAAFGRRSDRRVARGKLVLAENWCWQPDSEEEDSTNNPKSINFLLIYQDNLKFLSFETMFSKAVLCKIVVMTDYKVDMQSINAFRVPSSLSKTSKLDSKVKRIGPHIEIFQVFRERTRSIITKKTIRMITIMQAYVRGWLERRRYHRILNKALNHGPSLRAVINMYHRLIHRVKHRLGLWRTRQIINYSELEEWMDRKKFYETMFAKRQDWQGLERSELLKFFNDCGHYPTLQQIDQPIRANKMAVNLHMLREGGVKKAESMAAVRVGGGAAVEHAAMVASEAVAGSVSGGDTATVVAAAAVGGACSGGGRRGMAGGVRGRGGLGGGGGCGRGVARRVARGEAGGAWWGGWVGGARISSTRG